MPVSADARSRALWSLIAALSVAACGSSDSLVLALPVVEGAVSAVLIVEAQTAIKAYGVDINSGALNADVPAGAEATILLYERSLQDLSIAPGAFSFDGREIDRNGCFLRRPIASFVLDPEEPAWIPTMAKKRLLDAVASPTRCGECGRWVERRFEIEPLPTGTIIGAALFEPGRAFVQSSRGEAWLVSQEGIESVEDCGRATAMTQADSEGFWIARGPSIDRVVLEQHDGTWRCNVVETRESQQGVYRMLSDGEVVYTITSSGALQRVLESGWETMTRLPLSFRDRVDGMTNEGGLLVIDGVLYASAGGLEVDSFDGASRRSIPFEGFFGADAENLLSLANLPGFGLSVGFDNGTVMAKEDEREWHPVLGGLNGAGASGLQPWRNGFVAWVAFGLVQVAFDGVSCEPLGISGAQWEDPFVLSDGSSYVFSPSGVRANELVSTPYFVWLLRE